MTANAAKPLAQESPVEIVVNDALVAVLMCTPLDLDELALGHAFCKGIIRSLDELKSIKVCDDRSAVRLESTRQLDASIRGLGLLIPSACGSGAGAMDEARAVAEAARARAPTTAVPVGLADLKRWARDMFSAAQLYGQTGGTHCAALVIEDEGRPRYFVVREDVGRHNAVDKTIGRGLLDGADFSRSRLICSGRISADLMQKAAAAAIPVVASRSIPTSSAYELALLSGTAMVGRLGSGEPIVYTRQELFS